jgi:hypothetical protein
MIGMNLLLPPPPPPASVPQTLSLSSASSQPQGNLTHLSEKLLVRQLLLSIQQGNSESAHLLGSYFLQSPPPADPATAATSDLPTSLPLATPPHEFPLNHLSALYPSRLQSALHWYSKSSAMGNPFGSLQCGLIHHFGILNNPCNLQRAERYYQLALEQYDQPQSAGSGSGGGDLKIVCEGMLWLIQNSKSSSLLRSLSTVVGWGLRWIFFQG